MAHGWTDARRAKQAKAVWRWRLWQHSTGPRTAEGKARSSRNAYRGGHRQNAREAARLLAQLTPRIEAGDPGARAEIMRRILAGNVELFFRCLELAESESYNPKLWIDPLMKKAAYPSV
jgi:hypothetical protein